MAWFSVKITKERVVWVTDGAEQSEELAKELQDLKDGKGATAKETLETTEVTLTEVAP